MNRITCIMVAKMSPQILHDRCVRPLNVQSDFIRSKTDPNKAFQPLHLLPQHLFGMVHIDRCLCFLWL